MSLSSQLPMELCSRFVCRKGIYFFNCCLSSVFRGGTDPKGPEQRLHLSTGDTQHKPTPEHPKGLHPPRTSLTSRWTQHSSSQQLTFRLGQTFRDAI